MEKKILRKVLLNKARVYVGKSGISESVIEEIKAEIKKNKAVKVKILRSFIKDKDKDEVAKELADKSDSKIIRRIGFVVVLAHKNF